MFLSTVILFLQEILEAALLISVLLVLTRLFNKSWGYGLTMNRNWVAVGLLGGSVLGWVYAQATPMISEWFDYVGQDITNAALLFFGFALLVVLTYTVPNSPSKVKAARRRFICLMSMTLLVVFSVMREGSEMILYLGGGIASSENVASFFSGGAIGTGIGISCGVFLFYSLSSLSRQWSLRVSILLLALVNGAMASQIIMLLSQADWVPFTPVAWNTSAIVNESSISGRLLYALIGYEATPSVLQVIAYCFGVLAIVTGPLFRHAWLHDQTSTAHVTV